MTPSELLTETYKFIKTERSGFNMRTWKRCIWETNVTETHTPNKCTSIMCIGGTMEYLYTTHSKATRQHFNQLLNHYARYYSTRLEDLLKLPLYEGIAIEDDLLEYPEEYDVIITLADIINVNPLAFYSLCHPSRKDSLWRRTFETLEATHEVDTSTWNRITRDQALAVLKNFAVLQNITLEI